jgi:hypothetical protein
MIKETLPSLRKSKQIDFVIANCENAAHGRGVTRAILTELQAYGIDFFTAGDHIWDQKEFLNDLYDNSLPIVRFYNYEGGDSVPGKPYSIIEFDNQKIIVATFSGMSFMKYTPQNPFWAADRFFGELNKQKLNKNNSMILIDFHGESTAEKLSFAEYVKDKASAVVGTHTHVGTIDSEIKGDLAYVTDVGMVGPLDSSLWVEFESAIHNFKYPFRKPFAMKEEGRKVFNSVLIEFNPLPQKIERIDKIY